MLDLKNNTEKLIVESVNSKNISDDDINKICALEQDMWAREEWMWEYVECISCWKIHSKQDIFWNEKTEIYTKVVSEIEKILSIKKINCLNCDSETKHIYDFWELKEKILTRYNDSEAYTSILRDYSWDIKWFMDWYIDTFSTIYKRDFKNHYEYIWEELMWEYIKEILNWDLPSRLISYSALWTEEEYMNLYNIYKLLNNFFQSIPYDSLVWITELNSWKTLHALYNCWWIKGLDLSSKNDFSNDTLNETYNSDIFIQKLTTEHKNAFNIPISVFIKNNIKSIREILVD